MRFIAPAKQITGQIKYDDGAVAISECPARTDHSADDKKNIVGSIALTGDHLITPEADRASTQCGQRASERLAARQVGPYADRQLALVGQSRYPVFTATNETTQV